MIDYIITLEDPQNFYNLTRSTNWINIVKVAENEIVILVQRSIVIKFNVNMTFTYDGKQYLLALSNFTLTETGEKEVRIKGVNPITSFSFLDSSSQNKKCGFNIKRLFLIPKV